MSSAPGAVLKTASAIGTSAGSAARACFVRTARCGTTSAASRPVGGSNRVRAAAGAHAEAAEQRGRDVVGMALELGREGEQIGVELEGVVGGDEPGHVRRRARP